MSTSKTSTPAAATEEAISSASLPATRTAAIQVATASADADLPALIESAGPAARFAWEEFIYARVRNPYTRTAYGHAVKMFLRYCEDAGRELARIAPRDVASYLDSLPFAPSTKNLHLSAIRHFFDTLAIRHVVIFNPAASVRGERLQVVEGRTPEIGIEQARSLLWSIDTSNVVGLRDRAILGILVYTAVRVGAVAKLRRGDFQDLGGHSSFRFSEKGGKSREIPVRHDLEGFIREYLAAGCLEEAEKTSPLFRTTVRRTRELTHRAMTPNDMARMVRRRLKEAGLSGQFSPHSFRVTTITDLLNQGVPLEDVQYLAGHADPRTTRLYDRRRRQVTRNIVERISV